MSFQCSKGSSSRQTNLRSGKIVSNFNCTRSVIHAELWVSQKDLTGAWLQPSRLESHCILIDFTCTTNRSVNVVWPISRPVLTKDIACVTCVNLPRFQYCEQKTHKVLPWWTMYLWVLGFIKPSLVGSLFIQQAPVTILPSVNRTVACVERTSHICLSYLLVLQTAVSKSHSMQFWASGSQGPSLPRRLNRKPKHFCQ